MSRMYERFGRGDAAVGATIMEHGAEWVEILGYVGIDYAMIDMMNVSIDWGHAADLVRACARYDVTPWIRLQSFPWGGDSKPDPRLPSDVFRAIGIGAEVIIASVNTVEAIEAMLVPVREDNANDYVHTRPYINRPLYMPRDGTVRRDDDRSGNRWIVPDIESMEALDNLEAIVEIDGLSGFMLSLADISQAIGHPFDYRHPELEAIVRRATNLAATRGVKVFSFAGGDTPEDVAESARRLWSLGISGWMIPRMTFAAQRFYERTLRQIEDDVPGTRLEHS
ncbi:MAG TPA: aldolase/citrate lyase family protein [Solirubrobacteraceae bacterium]|jgi:4-hydroxy-2-oxoheptanedioate aldolase|nr:aldolase/citrate lyase family protein [Solirubrobacteraceae bacterium]